MNQAQIGQTVDKWIKEKQISRPALLRVIRINDPWYGMTEEEIGGRREFIRCYLMKDFELLLMIPLPPRENDFWFASHQEFMESAFNTWDFQRMERLFDEYGYRVKRVLERVKDLALLHSCISQLEGRESI